MVNDLKVYLGKRHRMPYFGDSCAAVTLIRFRLCEITVGVLLCLWVSVLCVYSTSFTCLFIGIIAGLAEHCQHTRAHTQLNITLNMQLTHTVLTVCLMECFNCMCALVCMHACVHVCLRPCMHACLHVCTCRSVHGWVCICPCVCMCMNE